MVFWYKTHLKQTLLVVFSLNKQDLIIEFIWLKIHNPEVDLQQEDTVITYCSFYCSDCQDIQKANKYQTQVLNACHFKLFSVLGDNSKEVVLPFYIPNKYAEKLYDQVYRLELLSRLLNLDLCATITLSQCLSQAFQCFSSHSEFYVYSWAQVV